MNCHEWSELLGKWHKLLNHLNCSALHIIVEERHSRTSGELYLLLKSACTEGAWFHSAHTFTLRWILLFYKCFTVYYRRLCVWRPASRVIWRNENQIGKLFCLLHSHSLLYTLGESCCAMVIWVPSFPILSCGFPLIAEWGRFFFFFCWIHARWLQHSSQNFRSSCWCLYRRVLCLMLKFLVVKLAIFSGIHSLGIPWAGTFVLSGILFRIASMPLHVYAERLSAERFHVVNTLNYELIKVPPVL